MLRHEHVAYNPEAKFGPQIVQRSDKLEAKALGVEKRNAPIDALGKVM